jgi:alkaline phosphatase
LTSGDPRPIESAKTLIADLLGLADLSLAESRELESLLEDRTAKKIETFLGRATSRRAGLGWASTNHSGEDVPLFVQHPRGLRIGGVIQNTDIAVYISKLLGFNLASMTARLFVPAAAGYAALGAAVSIDAADSENPVLVATKGGRELRIPVFKSLALLDGRPVELGGVVVSTGTIGGARPPDPKTWYVPRRALDLLK